MTRALLLLALALVGCEGCHVESEPIEGGGTKVRALASVENNGTTPMTVEAWVRGEVDTFTIEPGYFTLTSYDSFRVIAQADPTTEADWPWRARTRWPDLHIGPLPDAYSSIADSIAGYPYPKDSLTVTNATAHTLILEQAHVVTLAMPDSTYTVELVGPVTIREEGSYDD